MTAPRQILPGATYLVTRRCFQRQYLLRPTARTNGIFRYVLAAAARRFGIQLHAYCVLSNHFHLLLTDPQARLPAFEQYLDSLVARAVNALLGRWESFWAPSSYSAVALASCDDVVAKAAYVLANPVAAGLVTRGADWPGLWSEPARIGAGAIEVPRPEDFFRARGPLPSSVPLELVPPPGLDAAHFRQRLAEALAEAESSVATDGTQRPPPRCRRSAAQPTRPSMPPGATGEPRRRLRPRVAARDPRVRVEALARLKAFLTAYRAAWTSLRAGIHDVVFPFGTYGLRVGMKVRCATG